MKAVGYGFICFANLLYLIINTWKAIFSMTGEGLAVFGALICFIHLCFFFPRYLRAHFGDHAVAPFTK